MQCERVRRAAVAELEIDVVERAHPGAERRSDRRETDVDVFEAVDQIDHIADNKTHPEKMRLVPALDGPTAGHVREVLLLDIDRGVVTGVLDDIKGRGPFFPAYSVASVRIEIGRA